MIQNLYALNGKKINSNVLDFLGWFFGFFFTTFTIHTASPLLIAAVHNVLAPAAMPTTTTILILEILKHLAKHFYMKECHLTHFLGLDIQMTIHGLHIHQ